MRKKDMMCMGPLKQKNGAAVCGCTVSAPTFRTDPYGCHLVVGVVLRTVSGTVLRAVLRTVLRAVLGTVLRAVLRIVLRTVLGAVLAVVLVIILRVVLAAVGAIS